MCSSDLFYTVHFSLRQRPRFLYCPFLVAAAPPLFLLTISCCGSAPSFYTVLFCCGSAPAFYSAQFLLRKRPRSFTDHFSLRQRPLFLYRQILVVAAPLHFILTNSRCGSAPAFYTAHFSLQIGRASCRERV